ncbi:MAG: redoxin domain-containing protein [Planctomycetes bacterium]|nr:redoxin domain-containing protein [Planctomycetota bacterium]
MRQTLLRTCFGCLAFVLAVTPCRADDKLMVGSSAPALAPTTMVKGQMPDLKTSAGCVVVHFLVSSEAPSRNSVMVMNRLHKELGANGAVQIVGIFDEDAKDVETFAKGSGAPEYPIASDRDGNSRREWLGAAELKNLPQAFIVARGGKILWIGNPLESTFDGIVRKAMSGRYDPAARERIDPALKAAKQCADVRNWGEAYKHFDEAIDVEPGVALDVVAERYKTTLLREGKPEAANAWLVQTTKKRFTSDLGAVSFLVDMLLTDPEVKPRNPETASQLIDLCTVKNGAGILSLRAKVANAGGDMRKAVDLQTDAWMAAPPEEKAIFKRQLDEYRAAAKRPPAAAAPKASDAKPATEPKSGS